MPDPLTDLAAYYDQEAAIRVDRPVGVDRLRWREAFITSLLAEQGSDVIEIGCGPGRDAPAFHDSGLKVTGLDLSIEQLVLAADRKLAPVRASVFDLPFRANHFDGAWSMSVLVHVPDARFDEAMAEICSVVVPGGLLGLGFWGGADREGTLPSDTIKPARFFSWRSDQRLRTKLGSFGELLSFETVTYEHLADEHYQFAVLKTAER